MMKNVNKSKMKNNKMKSFKYLIPGLIVVVLISTIFLSSKFIRKQAPGNVYNIIDAETNFDIIEIGDEINYEINGCSNWQVIGKNNYEGTIDVVSKTNAEYLTIEGNKNIEYYQNIFQETANKYTNNSYVIKARTVEQSDLDLFSYEDEFWLNDIEENQIKTSKGLWENAKNYKIYLVPYIEKEFENMENYSPGDIIEYSNNGVDRWVVSENEGTYLRLIPEIPIEIEIKSTNDSIYEIENQIVQSFNNDVMKTGNYLEEYDRNNLSYLIPNFLNQQTERIYLISWSRGRGWNQNRLSLCCGASELCYENGTFEGIYAPLYIYTPPMSLGYRPVVTLKLNNKKETKEISDELQIGDYVNYNANSYKNWKVLSIDKVNNTIDIISGGITKNITLNGEADYNDLESILQSEVEKYRVGENVIATRSVENDDIILLNRMNDKLGTKYWTNNKKKKKTDKATNFAGSNTLTMNTLNVEVMYYDYDEEEIMKKWQPLSLKFSSGNEDVLNYYRNNGFYINPTTYYEGDSLYTAGLRPIITLKLDSAEKLPEEEAENVEKSTANQEKIYIKEQEYKNKDYTTPDKVNDTTNSTDISKNNKECNIKTDNNSKSIEKIVYKDKPLYKYGFIIFLITSVIELGIIIYMTTKIKK